TAWGARRFEKPEEQLRGGNKPWEKKFEGKSRLYEQKLYTRPAERTMLLCKHKSNTSSKLIRYIQTAREERHISYSVRPD
ncbi:MAG: hypothetical protein IKL98_04020, partial [Akkermansia sp.]|nr:hypothetical protein [Akkermansia sp.]